MIRVADQQDMIFSDARKRFRRIISSAKWNGDATRFARTVSKVLEKDSPLVDAYRVHLNQFSTQEGVEYFLSYYRNTLLPALGSIDGTVGLDFGCWSGVTTRLLASLGPEKVFGFDIGAHLESFNSQCFDDDETVEFSIVYDNSFPSDSCFFDWVFVNQVFCNMRAESWEPCLQELVRVTKPGGLILIADSNNPHCEETRGALEVQHLELEIGSGDVLKPNGGYFRQRLKYIEQLNLELGLGVRDEELFELARTTCYCDRQMVKDRLVSFAEGSAFPPMEFENDFNKAPISIDGGQASCVTDPYYFLSRLNEMGVDATLQGHTEDSVYQHRSFVVLGRKH